MIFITALLCILCSSINSEAQIYQAAASKAKIEITISPATADEFFLVFKESNKAKQNFQLKIDGPSGLKVSIKSAMGKKGEASTYTAKNKTSYATKIFTQSGAGKMVYQIGGAPGGEIRDPECGCLTETEIANWLELLASVGQIYTREQLCAQVYNPFGPSCSGYPGGNSNTANGTLLRSFISRDQCSGNSHLAIVKLNLSDVDKTAGGVIKLVGRFKAFKGKKASSIKAKGDGKYPQPLFLASPVGNYYDFQKQSILLSKWNGDLKNSSSIKIADVIYYGPVGALLRIPLASSLLTGGKGTFEVISEYSGYSVCADLVAKRQAFNGYPIPK